MRDLNLEDRLSAVERAVGVPNPGEQERVQRQREADRAAFIGKQKAHRAELKAHVANYISATAEAENAVRALAVAIGKVLAHSAAISKTAHALSGKPSPIALGTGEVVRRLACRICAVLSTAHPDHRYRLGHVDLHSGHHRPQDMWVDRENAMCETHIKPLIEDC